MNPVVEKIKIGLEDELTQEIVNDPLLKPLSKFYKGYNSDNDFALINTHLKKVGVLMEANDYQNIYFMADEINQFLNIKPKVVFYKEKSAGSENALVTYSKNEIIISFSNDLLRLTDDADELKSIIAHEYGHYCYQHGTNQIINYLLDLDLKPSFAKEEEAFYKEKAATTLLDKTYLLSQIRELNADRLALLCTQNFEKTAIAGMKLSGGGIDPYGVYNPTSFLKQAESLIKDGNYFTYDELSATHPYESLRTKYLHDFYHSKLFYALTGKGDNRVTDEELDAMLPQIVPIDLVVKGKPNNSTSRQNNDQLATDYENEMFLMMAAEIIMGADGKVTKRDKDYISEIPKTEKSYNEIMDEIEHLNADEFDQKYVDLVKIIKKQSARKKTFLIKKLVEAARYTRTKNEIAYEMLGNVALDIDALPQLDYQLGKAKK
ncbi:MAG: M48 family metalloprotease [Cyclobacteriaceae bacterium]|nr:M48 family metalloprotease [Cyclobacteriaceae bacterium]MCH8517190.1 M48 family metalloprotease [Cyclobacteriaceae bacterium]